MHAASRYALVAATALVALVILVALLLRHEPAFLQAPAGLRGEGVSDAAAERLAARMVTNASALHAAIGRKGAWDAVFTDAEVNAWLAVDLPRNHRALLPAYVSAPRVRFRPRHVSVEARLGYGMLRAVAWADLEVELRGVGQLRITPARTGLGAIPLPGDFTIRQLADGIRSLGLLTELRRVDGRLSLFVAIPIPDADRLACRLESLQIDDGEMLLAGATRSAGTAGRAALDDDK